MKALVTFAVAAEFSPWLRLRKDWIAKDAALHAYEFSANDLQVCVILTGIGCRRAWDASAIAYWGSDFDVCISSGLAGALRPEHKLGAVLVARGVRQPGKHDLLPCDPDLVQSAAELGAKPVEAFCTADRILVKAVEKTELSRLADAVDMESRRVIGIAAFGSGWSARCVAIRAVSDEAREDLPVDFTSMLTHSGDIHVPTVVKEVIRKPWIIPRIIRFAGRSRRAARELALFLDKFVLALPSMKKLEIFEEVAAT